MYAVVVYECDGLPLICYAPLSSEWRMIRNSGAWRTILGGGMLFVICKKKRTKLDLEMEVEDDENKLTHEK